MALIHSGRLRSSDSGGDPVAKDDLVYVQTREGQGYKMTKADAERYIKRNSSAKIVDPNAPTVATTDEGSDEGQTKKSGKDKK